MTAIFQFSAICNKRNVPGCYSQNYRKIGVAVLIAILLVMFFFLLVRLNVLQTKYSSDSLLLLRGVGSKTFFTKFQKQILTDNGPRSNNLNKADASKVIAIHIDTDFIKHVTGINFISVTLDTSLIQHHWEKMDLRSETVLLLAKALSPCYLRVGGTMADFLFFNDTETRVNHSKPSKYATVDMSEYCCERKEKPVNFTMTAELWNQLNEFVEATGWEMIFDLNVLIRKNGHWDPSNAISLLKYSASKGYKITGFELGNEPNSFNHTIGYRIEYDRLAEDFSRLRRVLKSFPDFKSSILIGPDTNQLSKKRALVYFRGFLKSGGSSIVKAASFHQYYVNSRNATLEQFVNSTILDLLSPQIIKAKEIMRKTAPKTGVWLGETSSSWGGGAKELSDRYAAGFMWMDKLGISASFGVDVVIRQSFYGGYYSLINHDDSTPNPDYWLTLLYKTLVGRNVLNVTLPMSDLSEKVRVYGHCTNTLRTNYTKGSVTVYGMNLLTKSIQLDFSAYPGKKLLFLLEPHDGNLKSRHVNLNGRTLKLTEDKQLPNLFVPLVRRRYVHIPPKTFVFIVIPGAKAKACQP